jgi:hypothetical protein
MWPYVIYHDVDTNLYNVTYSTPRPVQHFTERQSAIDAINALNGNGPGPPGRIRALDVSRSKSVLYGAIVWARRAFSRPNRWFPGPGAHKNDVSSAGLVG